MVKNLLHHSYSAVILSGGFGTRLRPLTLSRPKAILPILNKPFCLYPLEWLARYDVRYTIFATGYRSRDLVSLLKRERPQNINVDIKTESKPLGTGGALRRAGAQIPKRFFALNGDILTDFDLSRMLDDHIKSKAMLTLALVKVPDVSRYGSVTLRSDGSVREFKEKKANHKGSGLINAGVYIIEPEVIRWIPSSVPCSLERDVFPLLAEKGEGIFGHPIKGYWKDVGTISSYLESHRDLLNRRSMGPVLIGRGTRLGRNVRFEGTVCIGENCRIGSGVRIKDSVILDQTKIGNDATIIQSVLSYRCQIGSHAVLGRGMVLGEGSQIQEYSQC